MVEGKAHTLVKQRRLHPTMPQLWNRRRTSKQGDPVMQTQHASGAGSAVKLSQKAEDRVCPSALNPSRIAVRKQTTSGLSILSARDPFGALQTSRECEARKQHFVRWLW
jgi:hypothetical protein